MCKEGKEIVIAQGKYAWIKHVALRWFGMPLTLYFMRDVHVWQCLHACTEIQWHERGLNLLCVNT